MNEKPLIGILAGIAIWLVTSVVAFGLRRHRLKRALVEDLKHRIVKLDETTSYLATYYKQNVAEGVVIKRYHRFTKDPFGFYEDVRADLYKYFGAQKLITIMRCYEALGEIEILMEGLGQDLRERCQSRQGLTKNDVAFLGRKRTRLENVIKILRQKEIKGLRDLPTDYHERLSPDKVIQE
jgi:hypothetical protein